MLQSSSLYPHHACNAVLHYEEDAVPATIGPDDVAPAMIGPGGVAPATTGPDGVAPAPMGLWTGAGGALPLLFAAAAAALLPAAAVAALPLSDVPPQGKACTHSVCK